MTGRPPEAHPDLARRGFLKACAALASAPLLAGCGGLAANGRFTGILLKDPGPAEYRPVLAALIRAVLPFEHPRFPRIPPEWVLGRLQEMFPLEQEARFQAVQRSLLLFEAVSLFPHAFGPLRSEERARLAREDGRDGEALDRALAEAEASDRKLHAAFAARHGDAQAFTALDAAAGREYLWLWSQSAFTLKRQFYRTAKALVLITASTHPGLWAAIGYAGPLPGRT